MKIKRPKSSKIYIRQGEKIFDFMWVNVTKDGSVMVGVKDQGKGFLEVLFDKDLGDLRPKDFSQEISARPFKITFHKSGMYKLGPKIALPGKSYDRCTLIGLPLDDISEPRLMLEVMIANKKLKPATNALAEQDIVLDATPVKNRPLRCAIFCMSKTAFHQTVETDLQFFSTSEYECRHQLVHSGRVWIFVLRVSREDNIIPREFKFFVSGMIKWASN